MKIKLTQLIAIICACLLLQGGCASTQQFVTTDNARTATSLVCSGILIEMKDPVRQQAAAKYVYSVATAVRTLSGGNVPTPEELNTVIRQFTPASSNWAFIAQAIGAVWANYYPQVKGNPKLALQYLEAIASGCETAARPFIGPGFIGPPITPSGTVGPNPDYSPWPPVPGPTR